MQSGHLELNSISQRYGTFEALSQVSLEVHTGEFMTLLGPSGSGKTTTLRIVAGFLAPDTGSVLLDSKDLTHVSPHQRDIGMVFQNYALFPHMTIAENISFPLEMRKLRRPQIKAGVEEILEMVHLSGLGGRHPRELSGGQQQRVALARALVSKPRLLLMDEPLGALDRKLRETMQLEIVRISRQLGITVLYVTHDQEEALAMSHRIAVYNKGRIEQVGAPEEVYQRPANLFVANFVGESTTFSGTLEYCGDSARLVDRALTIPVGIRDCKKLQLAPGESAAVVIRPEAMGVRMVDATSPSFDPEMMASLRGRLQSTVYLGSSRKHMIELPHGATAIARTHADDRLSEDLQIGSEVDVFWAVSAGIVLRTGDQPTGCVPPMPITLAPE